MTEGGILLTSEREARYSDKKRKKVKKEMKLCKNEKQQVTILVLEESHQWVSYIQGYKNKNRKII